jgi:hypothetical protein
VVFERFRDEKEEVERVWCNLMLVLITFFHSLTAHTCPFKPRLTTDIFHDHSTTVTVLLETLRPGSTTKPSRTLLS